VLRCNDKRQEYRWTKAKKTLDGDIMEKIPEVFVIILNWNETEDTIKCINSFLHLEYLNYDLIVIDNGSTDDSVRRIKERFPQIKLIETNKNLGYAGGNNVGIKYAMDNKAGYVLIVNNDTELVNPYFVQEMVKKMEEDSSIGIMGPRVLNLGGQVQDTILFTPRLLGCIKESFDLRFETKKLKDYNMLQRVEAVSGVCWLIKRRVIEEIGLLDEDYFMYAEEQEYCYRAKKTRWKIMYFPVESIVHKKGPNDENKERIYRQYVYARRNLILFLRKHFGFGQAFLLALLFLISNILKVVLSRLTGRNRDFYNMSLLSVLFSKIRWALNKQRM